MHLFVRTELRAKDTEISAKSNEIMQNLEIIKAFGVENQIYDKWNDIAKKEKDRFKTTILRISFRIM